MAKVAVLLNGSISHDSRVIKSIKTMAKMHQVDLFYINGEKNDSLIFKNLPVGLHSTPHLDPFFSRILRHTFFYNEFLFLEKTVLKNNVIYDFIVANDLPCLKPAVALKKRMKAKLIYDSHEIYTETLNQFFPKNPPFFKKPIFDFSLSAMRFLGEREEKKLLYSVDHFITVGEGLKIYFTKKYGFADIKVVMNCPSLDTITTKAVDLHSLLKIAPGQFIVIYQGTLNQGRGLDTLIKAFSEVDKHISLVILGDGPFLDYLVQLTTQLGLEDRVYFHKSVPLEELAGYTKGADIGISLLEDFNLSKKYAAPNKLFEYLHAGLPVIINDTFESEIVFNKYKIGKLTKMDSNVLAASINTVSKENLEQYREECKKAAQEYCWEKQEKVLLALLK